MSSILESLRPSPAMAALVGGTVVLLWWMDQGAVLRGRGGGKLPWITDKLFRSLFLVAWSSIFILPVLRHILPISLLVACFAVYLPSYLDGSEQNVARKSLQVQRHWAWEWIKQRYNLKIHVEEKLDPGKTYVLGVHPHSILPWGSCVNLVTPVNDEASGGFHTDFAFPKLHWVGASVCFYVPLYRDLCLAGGVIEASRPVMDRALKEGRSLAVVVGGAAEAMYAWPGSNTLVLRKRYGFIAMALRNGADLVPVYTFGETDAFNQADLSRVPGVELLRKRWTRLFGTTLPMVTNIIPLRCNATTVIGRPIPVARIANPSDAEVEALLQCYVLEVRRIFDTYRPLYLPGRPHNLTVV